MRDQNANKISTKKRQLFNAGVASGNVVWMMIMGRDRDFLKLPKVSQLMIKRQKVINLFHADYGFSNARGGAVRNGKMGSGSPNTMPLGHNFCLGAIL